MILDKQIRESVTAILKGYAPLTAIVSAGKILDFPASMIDADDLPAVSVMTLQANDSSDLNDEHSDVILTLTIEIAANTISQAEDIEVQIDNAIVRNSVFIEGAGFANVKGVQHIRYSSSQTFFDNEGSKLRFVKALQYESRYISRKGVDESTFELQEIEVDLKTENKEGSQLDNSTLIEV